jgi:hypothetical protein
MGIHIDHLDISINASFLLVVIQLMIGCFRGRRPPMEPKGTRQYSVGASPGATGEPPPGGPRDPG